MAKPKGSPKTGGRAKGTPNKATREIKAIARGYGPAAIKEAAKLAGLIGGGKGKADSEAARIAALNLVLDRGYGKAAQPHTGEGGEGPVQIQDLLNAIDGKTRGIPTGGLNRQK